MLDIRTQLLLTKDILISSFDCIIKITLFFPSIFSEMPAIFSLSLYLLLAHSLSLCQSAIYSPVKKLDIRLSLVSKEYL